LTWHALWWLKVEWNGAQWPKIPRINMPTSLDAAQKPLVFAGEFRPLLDPKKRLNIIKSRKRGCLSAMPLDVLREMGEKGASDAQTTGAGQLFRDRFYSQAAECAIDSQGRMVLSEELCKFAGIEKEAVLSGSGAKFDIWNPGAWQRQEQATDGAYETMLENLGL
jgi:MraZ protein